MVIVLMITMRTSRGSCQSVSRLSPFRHSTRGLRNTTHWPSVAWFSQRMYRCAHCVSTSHCSHSLYHIRGSRQFGLCAQKSVCSFHLACAMSHAMHSTLSTPSSTSPQVDHSLRWPTRTQKWRFFGSLLPRVMIWAQKGPSTTRPALNRRFRTPQQKVRFQQLRISSLYPTISHCCLLLKILLKALLRLKKQTWTTNKFVLCWLHHGVCRSEKQVRNDRKFITLKEKACCPVRLKVWSS